MRFVITPWLVSLSLAISLSVGVDRAGAEMPECPDPIGDPFAFVSSHSPLLSVIDPPQSKERRSVTTDFVLTKYKPIPADPELVLRGMARIIVEGQRGWRGCRIDDCPRIPKCCWRSKPVETQ
ncbi:hypothetical protein NKDENANG_01631 [Candidatus Entotheonellaceae bacterium PAL068K]